VNLINFLDSLRFSTVLLYQDSVNGREKFHELCDFKGPTISLFKLDNGNCIGGYTKA
jgi:hypothetical protein